MNDLLDRFDEYLGRIEGTWRYGIVIIVGAIPCLGLIYLCVLLTHSIVITALILGLPWVMTNGGRDW